MEIFAVLPTADFSASNQAICVGGSTTITSNSSGTISTYLWNFGSGASPATANTIGPHSVTWSTTGSKTISLTLTGPDGTVNNTKVNYINVGVQRIKLMSYNLLNYVDLGSSDTTIRNPYFRIVISASDPDILVVQEVTSLNALTAFHNNVLNANGNIYSRGFFINGFDTDNGIFYKTSKFNFISNTPIETALRDINEFRLKNILTGDTIRIYSLHLKASSGSSNEAQRAAEVDSLRKFTNALPTGTDFIICGDFNIYGSSESAYVKLKQNTAGDEGHVIDPLNLTGTWNNSNYALYHTQCTRDTSLGGGGASGGMNDRFDMILYSSAVSSTGGITYVPGSTVAYGNDGNHYQKSIYIEPNNAVSQTISNALFYASDHLPVIANFDFALNSCLSVDLGPTHLLSPGTITCASLSKALQVRIKNFGLNSINFASQNATVSIQITHPSSSIINYAKVLTSGILAPGDSLVVFFDNAANMSDAGNYTFNVTTSYLPDVNSSNNELSSVNVTVSPPLNSTLTPPGPLSICAGTSVNISADAGSGYQWSNGSTTQSISVNSAGNYSCFFSDAGGCLTTTADVNVSLVNFQSSYNVISENMGTVSATTAIALHESNNGFQNASLTMTGSADIRSTTPSSGYVTASGGANVFVTNVIGRNFLVSGINTSLANNLSLSFGLYKSTIASNGGDFSVSYSTDGINYTPLTFPLLATGSGTAIWHYVTINESLPSASNLSIQFIQNGTVTQYRIDDVLISGFDQSIQITPHGPTSFCFGGSVTLSSSFANQYLWSTGETTQNIVAVSSGNYTVTGTSSNGCTMTSAPVAVNANACMTSIEVKVFIDGLYSGNGTLKSVSSLSSPTVCDTIYLQLADPNGLHTVLFEDTSLLLTDGTAGFTFPASVTGNSYYLIIRHRNTLESWSASPVFISNSSFQYDLTDSQGKIFGSNQKNLNDGYFALMSGDVDQNGSINLNDVSAVLQQLLSFSTGYLPTDLDGNGMVESVDFSVVENNLYKVVARP